MPSLYLLDSITQITPQCAGGVIVSGSHGGVSSTSYVLAQAQAHPPLAVFLNDAGVGKDRAGVVALHLLQDVGIACAVYSHLSARIGEAADGLASGRLSEVNALAARAGLQPGDTVQQAVAKLGAGP